MKFIKTVDGNYINVAHIKKISWHGGYCDRETDDGDYETLYPAVTVEFINGDCEELIYFDDFTEGDKYAQEYLERLVAKINDRGGQESC